MKKRKSRQPPPPITQRLTPKTPWWQETEWSTAKSQDGFRASTEDYSEVVVVFTRSQVEEGRLEGALEQLETLSESRDKVRKYQGRVLFAFDGWDEDPRELSEIPECVEFMRVITLKWPFWFHFIDTRTDLIQTLIAMLVVQTKVASDSEKVGVLADTDIFRETLLKLFAGMNQLHERFDIPDSVNRRITHEIEKTFYRFQA